MSTSNKQYRTITHERTEKFSNISINTKESDIILAPSGDERCRITLYERPNAPHVVTRKDGRLSIDLCDNRKWYQRLFSFGNHGKITVFLPKSQYGSISINLDAGNVETSGKLSFEGADVSVNSGNIKLDASVSGEAKLNTKSGNIKLDKANIGTLDAVIEKGHLTVNDITVSGDFNTNLDNGVMQLSNVTCKNLNSNTEKGPVSLRNVIATDNLSINVSNGGILFDGCDSSEIYAQIKRGDVSGSLLSDKIFITNVKRGKANLPKTVEGGRCMISVGVGKVEINIKSEN